MGDDPLEAPFGLSQRLALGRASVDVGAGSWTAAHTGQHDGVDGAVEAPITTAVEAMPDGSPAAGPGSGTKNHRD
jgi:hypothetical protein